MGNKAGSGFRKEVERAINRWSKESGSHTPDFILANYLAACLKAFDAAVIARAHWYGRIDIPGQGSVPFNAASMAEGAK